MAIIHLDAEIFYQEIRDWFKDDPVQEWAELLHESVVYICI